MDVVTERTASRLDRGHHRQHVQRQERGAHPPAAPGADREAEGPDLQAARSTTAYSEDHIVSHSDMQIRVGERAALATSCSRTSRPTPKSSGSTRGSSSMPNCRPSCNDAGGSGQARHRRGPRSGLSRPAVRADAAAAGDRRIHHQDARHLHGLRRPRRTTRSGSSPAASACSSARPGTVRSALPPLLRPGTLAGAEDVASPCSVLLA